MKDIVKYKLTFVGLLISIISISFVSCSDDESYDFPGNSGKVYVRLQPDNMVNSIPNIVKGSISKNILGVFGDPKISFPVSATMPAKENIEAVFCIDNAQIEIYNQQNNTSYAALDESKLMFTRNSLTINKGKMHSEEQLDISLNTEVLQDLEAGEYLIPVKLQKVSGMEVSEDWNTVYWIISVGNDISNIPFADRSAWTIADCSSQEDPAYEGGSNGPANCVLDGSNGTYWQTGWAAGDALPPHHITIDMSNKCGMAGFQYVTRNHSLDWPKTMLVEVSLDGESWNEVKTYQGLPQGANVEFRTLFDNIIEARYFRLTITEMYGGRPYTALAEVNAFVK